MTSNWCLTASDSAATAPRAPDLASFAKVISRWAIKMNNSPMNTSFYPENGVKIANSDGQALYGAQSMEPGDFATTTGGEIEPRAVSGVNELGGREQDLLTQGLKGGVRGL